MLDNILYKDLSTNEIYEFLNSQDQELAYITLLKITYIHDDKIAEKVFEFLKSNDPRIREISSFLIKTNIKNLKIRELLNSENLAETIVNSCIDTNPKICRNLSYTLQYINNPLTIIKKLIKIVEGNKNSSETYWSLFSLEKIIQNNNYKPLLKELIETINETSNSNNYQIREITSFIVRKLSKEVKSSIIDKLKDKLSKDQNFYVRRALSKF